MTETEGSGAAVERQLRRRYWALLLGGLVVAVVLGSLGRLFADPAGTIAPGAAIAIAVGLVLLMVGGTWIYFRSVDELEWANNLVAGFWGFNAFMLVFPVWQILWKGGFVPRPDVAAIYLGAATIALAAYLWGRFR